jgi:hypothetical protein
MLLLIFTVSSCSFPNIKLTSTDGIAEIAIWCTLEVGIAIIAGSVATLKPLLQVIIGNTRDPYYSKHGNSTIGHRVALSNGINHRSQAHPYSQASSFKLDAYPSQGLHTTVQRGEITSDNTSVQDDTASQRKMLDEAGEREEEAQSNEAPHGGIMVSYSINISNSDRIDDAGSQHKSGTESKVEELV